MAPQEMNTQPTPTIQSTRPTGLQITGARLQIHAQNHPVGYAVYGAGLTGAGTIFLALLMAAPALADPTGAPGWVLVAVAASALAVAPFLIVALAVAIRPLAEVGGPGFKPWMLMRFTPIVVILVAMVALYGSAKRKHAAVIAFRDEYDAA